MKRGLLCICSSILVGANCQSGAVAQSSDLEIYVKVIGSTPPVTRGYDVWGERELLVVEVLLLNTVGEAVVLAPAFQSAIAITLESDTGTSTMALPSVVKFDSENPPAPSTLGKDESVRVLFALTSNERKPFSVGSYALVSDFSALPAHLTDLQGRRWSGTMARRSTKPLEIRPARLLHERIAAESHRAQSYEAIGDLHSARVTYSQLTRSFPESAAGHVGLGHVALKERKFAEAAGAFEQALTIEDRRDSPLWYSLALAYVGSGREGQARTVLSSRVAPEQVEERLTDLKRAIAAR